MNDELSGQVDPYSAPPRTHDADGHVRTVGLELELAKISIEQVCGAIQKNFGGQIERQSRAEALVRDATFGTFKVEFDHSLLKNRTYLRPLESLGIVESEQSAGAQLVEESVLRIAAEIVPVEVITPPIPWDRLAELDALWNDLRTAGAADTHAALRYAFGLHLNPQLPDDDPGTVLAYLRAYLLLEDWLYERSHIDLSRRFSPFIRQFPEAYRRKVLAPDYAPDGETLVDDYLTHNPTRNRSLDMLPLFTHLHGRALLERVDEARLVKARPTFHYRLPNCELATPGWTPAEDWNRWVAVERLAETPARLTALSLSYLQTSELPLRLQSSGWTAYVDEELAQVDTRA